MANAKPKTTRKPAANKAAAAKPAAKPAAPVVVVVGQPEKPYRAGTARDAYWQAVQQWQGKPLAEFFAYLENPETCPLHAPALLRAGKPPEKASGWWAFFAKQGLVKAG